MARSHDDILDEWLVLRSQQGDDVALRELVTRWQPKLGRHANRLTGSPDAASDVLQESWLANVRGLPRLRDPAAFRAWAYKIVSRRCADWIRHRQHDRELHHYQADQAELADLPRDQPNGDGGEEISRMRQALKSLPGHQRSILSLFYIEELSVNEIAFALEIPPGTVKSRLHNARNRLREILERTTT